MMQDCHGKSSIQQEEDSFHCKLDLNLRQKLVKCYIWSIALCSAETWTLQKVHQKFLESFEMRCWRMTEQINWTNHVKIMKYLHIDKGQKKPTHNKKTNG